MEDLLLSTPTARFLETPTNRGNTSAINEEFAEAINDITNVLEHLSAEIKEVKQDTNKQIDELANIVATDHEELKRNTLESFVSKRFAETGEIVKMKKKIAELITENERLRKESEEKERVIETILRVTKDDNINQKWSQLKTGSATRHQNRKQRAPEIYHQNRFEVLGVEDSSDDSYVEEHEMTTQRNIQPNNVKQNKRPNIVINRKHENDRMNYRPKVVPGNSSYNDVVKYGKKTFILGTSMVKGMRMKEFNQHLKNSFCKLRSFPGASLKQLAHYALPTLVDETPNRVIIHGGCNDISNRSINEQNIANSIIDIANLCRQHGVNDIFISSVVCRKSNFLNEKIKKVNFLLRLLCNENDFIYIDNSNINELDLWEDGLHLLECGKVKLANNYINSLNSY